MGLGVGSLCGCAVPLGSSGPVPTAPVFVGLGMAPLPAGDAGVPASLWPCGVALVVVAPPVLTHALVRCSVACRPSMVPERP